MCKCFVNDGVAVLAYKFGQDSSFRQYGYNCANQTKHEKLCYI